MRAKILKKALPVRQKGRSECRQERTKWERRGVVGDYDKAVH